MRDKLEGIRSEDLTGAAIRKEKDRETLGSRIGRIAATAGWPIAFGALAIGSVAFVVDRRNDGPTAAATEREETPDRVYNGSTMTPFVVARFEPARSYGKTHRAARVLLIGKAGMRVERSMPNDCAEAPIEARVGRLVEIRVDDWKLAAGGTLRTPSEEDAKAALCGDFSGRDVAMPRRDASTNTSTDATTRKTT